MFLFVWKTQAETCRVCQSLLAIPNLHTSSSHSFPWQAWLWLLCPSRSASASWKRSPCCENSCRAIRKAMSSASSVTALVEEKVWVVMKIFSRKKVIGRRRRHSVESQWLWLREASARTTFFRNIDTSMDTALSVNLLKFKDFKLLKYSENPKIGKEKKIKKNIFLRERSNLLKFLLKKSLKIAKRTIFRKKKIKKIFFLREPWGVDRWKHLNLKFRRRSADGVGVRVEIGQNTWIWNFVRGLPQKVP